MADIETRSDSESSMLRGNEQAAANKAIAKTQEKYASKLREMGGVQGVLKNFEDYLWQKTGITEDSNKTLRNKSIPWVGRN